MRILLAFLVTGLTACAASAPPLPPPLPTPPELKDAFIGFEAGPFDSSETPDQTWYHQNALQIRGSELSLHKAPVYCQDGKLHWSSSDGGFLWYKGTISGGTATLTFVDCDYCGKPTDRSSAFYRFSLPISFPSSNTVKLGDVVYSNEVSPDSDTCPADA